MNSYKWKSKPIPIATYIETTGQYARVFRTRSVWWPGRSRLSLHTNCGFAVMHSPNLLQPTIRFAAERTLRGYVIRVNLALTCDTHGTSRRPRKFANLPPARPPGLQSLHDSISLACVCNRGTYIGGILRYWRRTPSGNNFILSASVTSYCSRVSECGVHCTITISFITRSATWLKKRTIMQTLHFISSLPRGAYPL